jgi:hypothetical protein
MQCDFAIPGGGNMKACLFQIAAYKARNLGVVINNQDFGRSYRRGAGRHLLSPVAGDFKEEWRR